MDLFQLVAPFAPMGDQPEAIQQLVDGFQHGVRSQVLLGVTGSGKTFTAANMIAQLNRPALILSHNKTLAAQLYSEFKGFFPHNRVEYFVSYYDYYQPEAYIPSTDTYIEKDLAINQEIEKLRLSTTSALLSGRTDVIVVCSVSCLYGIGNPEDFHENTLTLRVGQAVNRDQFLRHLVNSLYTRNEVAFERGNFRVKGDTVDVAVAYGDYAYRIIFWGNEIEELQSFDPITGESIDLNLEEIVIFPASIFVTTKERLKRAIYEIQDDLIRRIDYFNSIDKPIEAKRIKQRVENDLEMMRELGYCKGVENYSRYFDGRPVGSRPFCLLDYFPDNFITVIDESHVTIPQIRAMYGGDFARKCNLVEYGFRLPAALDNRPLKFDEFTSEIGQVLYVSATPADYELKECGGIVVEQLIRPTGVLDPPIEVRPTKGQIDDLLNEIKRRAEKNERIIVTTLTKKMAEHLTDFLRGVGVRCEYIHSDVDTLERVRILDELRAGNFDVLIGVNLLREGIDLPEVSLVAILDADSEGFLRSARALTQTAGRAARNVNGLVIMYAERITDSMQITIDETKRRREKQMAYNSEHNITPRQLHKKERRSLLEGSVVEFLFEGTSPEISSQNSATKKEKLNLPTNIATLRKEIQQQEKMMKQAAKEKQFKLAAEYRDRMFALQEQLLAIESK
ncbi:MAG: excinuclease ABC subunit UvrB [Bacteroides sp.]